MKSGWEEGPQLKAAWSTHSNMDWLAIILEQCYHQQSEKLQDFVWLVLKTKPKTGLNKLDTSCSVFFRGERGRFVSGCWLCRHNWLTDLIEKRFHSFLYIQEKVFHCGKCWHKLTTVLAQIRSNFIQFWKGISHLAFKKTPSQHDLRIVWKPMWTPFYLNLI